MRLKSTYNQFLPVETECRYVYTKNKVGLPVFLANTSNINWFFRLLIRLNFTWLIPTVHLDSILQPKYLLLGEAYFSSSVQGSNSPILTLTRDRMDATENRVPLRARFQ